MAYDRESIIRKLKKLREKAESAEAIGSEAEAQTFAEGIQKLLSEYKVEEAEIADNLESESQEIVRVHPDYVKGRLKVRSREVPWLRELGSVVALGNYCRLLVIPKTSRVLFAGRQVDAETAAEVYVKLVLAAESLADREYVEYFYECKKAGNVRKARGFRESFLHGFVRRIGSRYVDHMQKIREYYAHDKKALTVLGDATKKVDDWLDKNVHRVADPPKEGKIQNYEGYKRGGKRAQDVKLTSHAEVEASRG